MKFALNIPLASLVPKAAAGSRAATVRTMSRALEEAGLSACLTSEHPAPSAQWLHNDPGAHDCVDPLTALAFVAGATEQLKVFTNVLVLPFRNPFLAAKSAASLQVISDNRLLLGVGVGYMKAEFEALGVDYAERGALMDEAIETIRLAWSGGAIDAKGKHFDAVGIEPRPIPDPAPPIWVGGGSDRALERAAKLGDGWLPYFTVPTNSPDVRRSAVVDMDHFGEKLAKLRERREELGRTGPFDLAVAPPFRPKEATSANAQRFLEEVSQLAEQGVNWTWTSVPAPSLEEYLDTVRWFGEEVIGEWRKG